jgi:hypothetical protein
MSRLSQHLRTRRHDRRSRQAIASAIANAPSPALRDELITVVQRHGGVYIR